MKFKVQSLKFKFVTIECLYYFLLSAIWFLSFQQIPLQPILSSLMIQARRAKELSSWRSTVKQVTKKKGNVMKTRRAITIKGTGGEVAAMLSYGINDNLDVVFGLPYQWSKVKEDGKITSDEDGISDISIEAKWRLYEKDGISLALKPGITFPTGDNEKGLGTGKITYSIFFITTKEIEPWAFHLNIGYNKK